MTKVVTLNGTTIQRDPKYKVGKRMGNYLYVHRLYEGVLPTSQLKKAKKALSEDFEYTIVRWDIKNNSFSFTASPNWDSAHEPEVGDSYRVNGDGTVKHTKKSNLIYHHKWLFVMPDYKGFDVTESINRSIKWLAIPGVDMNRIGRAKYWEENVVSKL